MVPMPDRPAEELALDRQDGTWRSDSDGSDRYRGWMPTAAGLAGRVVPERREAGRVPPGCAKVARGRPASPAAIVAAPPQTATGRRTNPPPRPASSESLHFRDVAGGRGRCLILLSRMPGPHSAPPGSPAGMVRPSDERAGANYAPGASARLRSFAPGLAGRRAAWEPEGAAPPQGRDPPALRPRGRARSSSPGSRGPCGRGGR